MSLPPAFLDELRSRLSLAQVVGRKVQWDMRKSNQAKGDFWAPCPFHQEKTASFHVDDRKGFYYCFGCHAKGNAFGFVQETENVGFLEAVEILAQEVGLAMPARDPQASAKADRRSQLLEVMEEAVKFYRLQLKTAAAARARDYLLGARGLSPEALERWKLGFAPDGWQALWDHLTGKGIAPELLLACGLAKPSDKGRQPYDVFRNRIVFPIHDPRGRAIAFGGRAMDAGNTAKYINSPETDLFDKGRSLYNHGPAREAAGKGQPLIVAEGYMDVIALSEAGFGATVAPLGTAITEDQLRLLWRIAPEPVIALDGDGPGVKAAMRLIDLALPLLEAGQSLRFCLMPEGQDPDELLKASGPEAMQAALAAAQPMVSLLWRRETDGKVLDSPERRAALDRDLRAVIRKIADPAIRAHYAEEIRRRRGELFAFAPPQAARAPWRGRGKPPAAVPVAGTRASLLAAAGDEQATALREAVILATLIRCPCLLEDFGHLLEDLDFAGPGHAALAALLLGCDPNDTQQGIESRITESLGAAALESLHAPRHVTLAPSVRKPGDVDVGRQCLKEAFEKLLAQRGGNVEVSEVVSQFAETQEPWMDHRLAASARARELANKGIAEDQTEYEVGENGFKMDREERNRLDDFIRSKVR